MSSNDMATNSIRLVRRFVKPKFIGTELFASQGDGLWRQAFPPRPVGSDRAVRYGRTPDFLGKLDPIVPAIGAIESSKLYVAGSEGLVCTAEGVILDDHSWFRGHSDQMKPPRGLQEVQHLPGRAVSIMSDWATGSYGHFIQDVLPRFAILERLGLNISLFDHIIGPAPNEFCFSLLEKLGVDRQKLVQPKWGVALKPELLVATTLPGSRRSMQPWSVDFIRKNLNDTHEASGRLLYITRPNRKPTNESTLISIVREYGFEIYNPGDDPQNQIAHFADADVVVGSEGSAMANLIFCKPGTKVLELLASDHIFPYYYSIAMSADLQYNCIVGDSLGKRKNSSIGASPFDFDIDEALFRQALEDITSRLKGTHKNFGN